MTYPCQFMSMNRGSDPLPPNLRCVHCRHTGCAPGGPCSICMLAKTVEQQHSEIQILRAQVEYKSGTLPTPPPTSTPTPPISIGTMVHVAVKDWGACNAAIILQIETQPQVKLRLQVFGPAGHTRVLYGVQQGDPDDDGRWHPMHLPSPMPASPLAPFTTDEDGIEIPPPPPSAR